MRKIFLLIIGVFGFFIAYSQDIITLKTGEELNVKVTEVGSSEIKYKKSESGPLYSIEKKDVFMIKYSDGSKDVFNSAKQDSVKLQPVNIHTDYEKGVRDAEIFYSPSGASTGTFLTTLLLTPAAGLVPAIICSSTTPKEINLNIPLDRKFLSDQYRTGYKEKAANIKKRKVWSSWGIAFGIDVGIYFVLKNTVFN